MSVAPTTRLQFGEVVADLHPAIFGVEDVGYNVRDRQTCSALFSYVTEFRKKAEKHSQRIQHGKKGRGEQL